MNLWKRITEFLPSKKEKDTDPYSIVLLLRKPHFFTKSEIEEAGEKGWGIRFDGKADPMHFVVQNGIVTLIKAGGQMINAMQVGRAYLDDMSDKELEVFLPREDQRKAWLMHSAWAAFDILNIQIDSNISKADAYATLARFALHLRDPNCTGIFFPRERMFIPNDGSAEEGLRMIIRKQVF